MPGSGRKQHGVTSPGELHQFDVTAGCGELVGKLNGLSGVGGAISSAMSEKQRPVTQHRNRLAIRQPRRQRGNATHPPAVSDTVIDHSQRHPATHGVPDKAYRQVTETLSDPVERPTCIRQRGLSLAIPPTDCVSKLCQRDAPTASSKHKATNGNQA